MKDTFYKKQQIIGLDISQTGIKVMAVNPKKWLVQGYGSIDLDPTKLQLSIDNPKDTYLADNLKSLFSEHLIGNMPSNHVAFSVPTNKSFLRTFTVPVKQEKKIASAVEIEVEQYIPIPMAALYVDYQVVKRTKETLTVALSAAPRSTVDAYLNAVRAAQLRPIAIEPGINSVARVLRLTEEGHLTTLIVDIGQANTDIAVYDGSAIQVSGGVAAGGNTFTIDIAKKLDTALENAHQLKILNGLLPSPRQEKLQKALDPSLKKIAVEIRKVLRYYTERIDSENAVEQVIILGAGSNVPGIGEYFTNELVMPARVASPWQKLNFGKLEQPGKQFRPRYITVAGLASIQHHEMEQEI